MAPQQKVVTQIAPREITVAFEKPTRLARTDTAGLSADALFVDSVVFVRGRLARERGDTVIVQVLSGQRLGAPDWEGGFVAVVRGASVTFDKPKVVIGPNKSPGPHVSFKIMYVVVPVIVVLALVLAP